MLRFLTLILSMLLVSGVIAPVFAGSPASDASKYGNMEIDTSQWDEFMKNLPTEIDPAMLERAGKVMPGDLNRQVERYKKELRHGQFKGTEEVLKYSGGVIEKEGKAESKNAGGLVLGQGEKISILISSSVPKQILRGYARDLDALREPGVTMVMRGFVDGMVKIGPTIKFVHSIIMKDEGCEGQHCEAYGAEVSIDPRIFRQYGIEMVPAVIYETGEGGDAYVLYGDAPIEGALEILNRKARSKSVECLIYKLRRGGDCD